MTTSAKPVSRQFLLLVASAAAFVASGAAHAGTPIDKRATVDPNGSIEVTNTAGTVMVTGSDRNEVQVSGELGDGTERLDFTTDGKVTRIKVILPNRSYNVDDTDLMISVPAASRLAVNTVSADIGVSGVTGAQRLVAVSGNVRTDAGAQDVECRTVSGDVHVSGSAKKGLLTINTVSGDVTALKVAGEVNANTVSGDVTLGMGETSRSRVRSTSGDLTLALLLGPDGKIDAESISGDVRLDFVGPVNAEFDISSFNGDIRNCFGPKPVSASEYAPGKDLRFREGQGSGWVRIKTMNGDISVCRK